MWMDDDTISVPFANMCYSYLKYAENHPHMCSTHTMSCRYNQTSADGGLRQSTSHRDSMQAVLEDHLPMYAVYTARSAFRTDQHIAAGQPSSHALWTCPYLPCTCSECTQNACTRIVSSNT